METIDIIFESFPTIQLVTFNIFSFLSSLTLWSENHHLRSKRLCSETLKVEVSPMTAARIRAKLTHCSMKRKLVVSKHISSSPCSSPQVQLSFLEMNWGAKVTRGLQGPTRSLCDGKESSRIRKTQPPGFLCESSRNSPLSGWVSGPLLSQMLAGRMLLRVCHQSGRVTATSAACHSCRSAGHRRRRRQVSAVQAAAADSRTQRTPGELWVWKACSRKGWDGNEDVEDPNNNGILTEVPRRLFCLIYMFAVFSLLLSDLNLQRLSNQICCIIWKSHRMFSHHKAQKGTMD